MTHSRFTEAELDGTVRISLPRAARFLQLHPNTLRRMLKEGTHGVPYVLVSCQPRFSIPMLKQYTSDKTFCKVHQPDEGLLASLLETAPTEWTDDDLEWLVASYDFPQFRLALLELFLSDHRGKSRAHIKRLAEKTYQLMVNDLGETKANTLIDRMAAERGWVWPPPSPQRRGRPRRKPNGKSNGKGRNHAYA